VGISSVSLPLGGQAQGGVGDRPRRSCRGHDPPPPNASPAYYYPNTGWTAMNPRRGHDTPYLWQGKKLRGLNRPLGREATPTALAAQHRHEQPSLTT